MKTSIGKVLFFAICDDVSLFFYHIDNYHLKTNPTMALTPEVLMLLSKPPAAAIILIHKPEPLLK
jgi:hypothetical protein